MQSDGKIDVDHVPEARRTTTRSTRASAAPCRCSPTSTASTTTRSSSRRPGSRARRRRCRELTAYAKKLTQRERRRLAQGRRLRPVPRLLREHRRRTTSRSFGARSGSTATASRPLDATRPGRRCSSGRRTSSTATATTSSSSGRPARATSSPPRTPSRRGKLAMIMDGEWRVAFIAARAPGARVRHGADARSTTPSRTSTAPATSTARIIGIPKNGKHKDAGLGSRQVPDDQRPRAREVLQRDQERPVDAGSLKSKELKPDENFATFLDDLREPELDDDADHPAGRGEPGAFQSFLAKWQAGKVEAISQGELAERRQADRREAEADGRRQVP